MGSTDPPAPVQLGCRIPLLAPGDLADEQQEIYQRWRAHQVPWATRHDFQNMTDDGRLIGSFQTSPLQPFRRDGLS